MVSVEALAAMVHDRTLTAAAVTEHALERIEALNPQLNAFVALNAEDARAQAAAIDERLDAGEDVGPLAGIPIGVKDLADAAGFVTTRGAMHLRESAPVAADSTEVARMRAAGAVILGKTNTPEFGCMGDTYNNVFGPTWNPWRSGRSPGGSSGGTSSAVASGMVPVGTGSDGGGSIRIPSAMCGMSGLKPSHGRVPSGPPPPGLLDLSCVGPMARRIRDVAYCLDAIIGIGRVSEGEVVFDLITAQPVFTPAMCFLLILVHASHFSLLRNSMFWHLFPPKKYNSESRIVTDLSDFADFSILCVSNVSDKI